VSVTAENPITGQSTRTNTAYLVYVALDERGRPTRVPGLIPENEVQEKRLLAGAARQAYRLAQRAQEPEEAG
jgi:acyl-CoA hydrolase